MNKILLVIFVLCVIFALLSKNWTAAMGWTCASIWLARFEFEIRPTKRATDGE